MNNNDTTTDTSAVDLFDGADTETAKKLLEDQLAARLADDPELVVVLNRDGSGFVLADSDTPLQTLLGALSDSMKDLVTAD